MRTLLVLLSILCVVLFVPIPGCLKAQPPAATMAGDLAGPAPAFVDLSWNGDGTLSSNTVEKISGMNGAVPSATAIPSYDGGAGIPMWPDLELSGDVTGSIGPGHMWCSKQAKPGADHGEEVDMGEIPPCLLDNCSDRRLMRGIPMWQWEARCHLWTVGEYNWPKDAGVTKVP